MFYFVSNGQFMFHLCSIRVLFWFQWSIYVPFMFYFGSNTQNTTPIKGIPKGGRAPKAPAPLWGGGRRPPPFMGVVFCVCGTK